MDTFFAWIESSAFSTWTRESLSIFAFPGILTLHTLGLACLAGASAAIDLRILGVAPALPLAPMEKFFSIVWTGFWVSAATGIALVIAYPAKALTNPLFFVKLTLVALAMIAAIRIRQVVFRGRGDDPGAERTGKILAAVSLSLWIGAIVSGRLLAYTYTRLLTPLDL